MKSDFMRRYPGPAGAHLNCLTEISLKGEYTEAKQKSIHPGGNRKKKAVQEE